MQLTIFHVRQVEHRSDPGDGHRQQHQMLALQLDRWRGDIRGTEISGVGNDFLDAGGRADSLVIECDASVFLEFLGPRLVNLGGGGRARAVNHRIGPGAAGRCQNEQRDAAKVLQGLYCFHSDEK